MLLYNLFPLLAGPFLHWESHLQRAAGLQFNWIFVNPIQAVGSSRSLYSITDYFSINSVFLDPESSQSPEDQVREVIGIAKGLGLQVMIDLVINHCAYDAELVRDRPQWFLHKNGKVHHPYCVKEDGSKEVWHDLASFDHTNTRDPNGLFAYFIRVIDYLAELGFRGFRCDAAYQLPSTYWERLIRETRRKYPDVVFAAETLGCTADQTRTTVQGGFDYIFNSSKWWNYSDAWLLEQYQLTRELSKSISFPESHDTARLCHEVDGNIAALKQRYLFSSIFSSGIMMPMGYEFGFRKPTHVVHSTPADWESTSIDLCEFILSTNRMVRQHGIFREECLTTILPYENPSILLLWKASTKTAEEALVVLNKDVYGHQHFYSDHLGRYLQAGAALKDVSPEYGMEYLPEPFDYDLRPGQAFVFVTHRD